MRIEGRINTNRVWIDGHELRPDRSQRVWNHSPDGFSWGFAGSGPAQLSLALLLHAGVDENTAMARHQELKSEVIAQLPQADFAIDLNISPDGKW